MKSFVSTYKGATNSLRYLHRLGYLAGSKIAISFQRLWLSDVNTMAYFL